AAIVAGGAWVALRIRVSLLALVPGAARQLEVGRHLNRRLPRERLARGAAVEGGRERAKGVVEDATARHAVAVGTGNRHDLAQIVATEPEGIDVGAGAGRIQVVGRLVRHAETDTALHPVRPLRRRRQAAKREPGLLSGVVRDSEIIEGIRAAKLGVDVAEGPGDIRTAAERHTKAA